MERARELLRNAQRPLFLFDDDLDGLCSFLILYHMNAGKGMVLKTRPVVDDIFSKHVKESDVVVVLDKPMLSREFIESCHVPIIWLDHHEPQDVPDEHVVYYNPHLDGKPAYPTSYWAYELAGRPSEWLWLAIAGCISDWQIVPDIMEEGRLRYPELLPMLESAPDYLFTSRIGTLIQIMLFNMKGRSHDVRASQEAVERVSDPFDILEQRTPEGEFLYGRYMQIHDEYQNILTDALSRPHDGPILLFIYEEDRTSMTSHLANELLYRFPTKVIIIGRNRNGEYKCSLRCSAPTDLRGLLALSLKGLDGYGGGHAQAVGACVKEADFPTFIERLRDAIEKAL